MAISMASLMRRSVERPPRLLVYGTSGIGKTTFGMQAPAPVFIQTEDSEVDVPTFGVLRTFADVMQALGTLYSEPHEFKSVILDSADWLEPLVWAETCRRHGVSSIEQVEKGFGKGYIAALDVWREILDGTNALRDDRDMTVILIGHAEIKRFDSPETEPYDRYQVKLQARASALVQEHVDCVLFANYRVSTVKADAGFNRKAVRGVGAGDRFLFTTERPAFLAKNRYALPDTLPLDWSAFAACVPYFNKGESKSVVNNASVAA